jgi:drug/metabolite transporter (DMT)-like permease
MPRRDRGEAWPSLHSADGLRLDCARDRTLHVHKRTKGTSISYLLAILTAVANATANVLMRTATRDLPPERQFRIGMVFDLIHRRLWLIGVGVSLTTYPLGALALGTGQLGVVQPILVLELPLTLLAAARVFGSRLDRRDWVGVAAMTVGLTGLIVFLFPHGGDPRTVPIHTWVIASMCVAVLVVPLVGLGWMASLPAARAGYLGAASGITYGLGAAYTKGMTMEFTVGGVQAVITTWQLYASIAAGAAATWLLQNAYAAGQLAAAQPGITLLDPAVAMAWGVLVFHEQTRGAASAPYAFVGALLMIAGAITLAFSHQLGTLHRTGGARTGN